MPETGRKQFFQLTAAEGTSYWIVGCTSFLYKPSKFWLKNVLNK